MSGVFETSESPPIEPASADTSHSSQALQAAVSNDWTRYRASRASVASNERSWIREVAINQRRSELALILHHQSPSLYPFYPSTPPLVQSERVERKSISPFETWDSPTRSSQDTASFFRSSSSWWFSWCDCIVDRAARWGWREQEWRVEVREKNESLYLSTSASFWGELTMQPY